MKAWPGSEPQCPQHARLDVFDLQRFAEQGVVLEVKHSQTKVEAGTPVSVYLAELVGAERCALDRRVGRTVRGNREFRIVRFS